MEIDDQIDVSRIAVIGHLRLGKAALWAGAQDTRFAMVVSNNAGCGGAAFYRRCYGERIHHMVKPVGDWCLANSQDREQELPVDQHRLMALVATRPLYVASAAADRWADLMVEFLAAKNAASVCGLFEKLSLGAQELPDAKHLIHATTGYQIQERKHDLTEYDWR